MPSLETIVRPVVLPDIKPTPRQLAVSPADDEQTEITSSGGSAINLTHSENISYSRSSASERREDNPPGAAAPRKIGRTFDIMRIYRIKTDEEVGESSSSDPTVPKDDKFVDRNQYIDTEIITRLDMINELGEHEAWKFKPQEPAFNMEVIIRDLFRPGD